MFVENQSKKLQTDNTNLVVSSSFSEDDDDSIADPDYRLESDNEQGQILDNILLSESQKSSVLNEQYLTSPHNHCALSKVDTNSGNMNVGGNLNEG